MTKAQLRMEIARKRRELDPQWVLSASMQIVQSLKNLTAFQCAKSVALYKAIDGEVDLTGLFAVCMDQDKRVCIPVFNPALEIYDMAEITANTQYKTGNHGIQEPENPSPVSVGKIDLIVVPGVAFDATGARLGRGGGYYDRLLDGFSGFSAAVAFDFQVYPQIPADSHDIPVDYVVTQTKIIKAQNEH